MRCQKIKNNNNNNKINKQGRKRDYVLMYTYNVEKLRALLKFINYNENYQDVLFS